MKNYNIHLSNYIIYFAILITLLIPYSSSNPIISGHNINRQLLSLDEYEEKTLTIDASLNLPNPRLKNAYIALQAWKNSIISDPYNATENWIGSDVCNYTGIFCSPSLDSPTEETVAGIDLNGADISGHIPQELGLLYDIALIHLNSNRFCGKIPRSFMNFKLLFELDLSNNRFSGELPTVFLQLPVLKFLDVRFNEFEGKLPERLFEIGFDAIFLNHNRFSFSLPENIGSSPASVIVLANNRFEGCLPASLINFSGNLNEIVCRNNGFESCLPEEIGNLKDLTVLDFGFNKLMGPLPKTIENLVNLQVLDLSHNMLTGKVPDGICKKNTKLTSFDLGYNFFTDESPTCLDLKGFDDTRNCLKKRPRQRSQTECKLFLSRPVNCTSFGCASHNSPPSPPPRCSCSCNPPSPQQSISIPPHSPIGLPPVLTPSPCGLPEPPVESLHQPSAAPFSS